MLSEKELRALVRDRKAWHRALEQTGEDESGGVLPVSQIAGAPRGLVRRGSADNALTLRFLSSLRTFDLRETGGPSSALHLLQKKWSPSTRIESAASDCRTDVLLSLLRRSAASRGILKTAEVNPRSGSPKSPKKHRHPGNEPANSHRQRDHRDATASALLLAQRLETLEQVERLQIVRQEAARRGGAAQSFVHESVSVLVVEEYTGRRSLFREAMMQKGRLYEAEAYAFTAVTGLSHASYAALAKLQARERIHRAAIAREYDHVRGIVEQLARLEEIRVVEREIAKCARHEKALSLAVKGRGRR